MSLNHVGNVQPSIDKEEHYHVGGVETGAGAKKVVVLDGDGNQVTSFGSDVSDLATSAKQDDIITELRKKKDDWVLNGGPDDTSTANVTYFGYEKKDGTWWIKKLDESSGLVWSHASITNNPTLTTYTLAWAARTTATYSDFSSAF